MSFVNIFNVNHHVKLSYSTGRSFSCMKSFKKEGNVCTVVSIAASQLKNSRVDHELVLLLVFCVASPVYEWVCRVLRDGLVSHSGCDPASCPVFPG